MGYGPEGRDILDLFDEKRGALIAVRDNASEALRETPFALYTQVYCNTRPVGSNAFHAWAQWVQ